jgi:type IV secretion system protein VirB9
MDRKMIWKSLRLALLASALACPALAQVSPDVPPLDRAGLPTRDPATIQALQRAQHAIQTGQVPGGRASAQSRITPTTAQASAQATMTTAQAGPAAGNGQGNGQGSVPLAMPPKIDPVSPDKALPHKAYVAVVAARHWIDRYQKPRMDADGVEHFVPGRGQVFVVAAVDHITDISLSQGEIIIPPVYLGDAADWKFHPAVSGSGRQILSRILLKPDDAGLSTNMVIETNKRTISVALASRRADYMPLVSLDMPDDTDGFGAVGTAAWTGTGTGGREIASPCDQPPSIGPDQFRIAGDLHVPWRPTQVWAVSTPVGTKTCIEFPAGIGSESLPVLLALANDGGWFSSPSKDVVNVRFVKRRYIADELLNRFVLVAGVGGSQQEIRVTRKEP